jgi:hypothetical protein
VAKQLYPNEAGGFTAQGGEQNPHKKGGGGIKPHKRVPLHVLWPLDSLSHLSNTHKAKGKT